MRGLSKLSIYSGTGSNGQVTARRSKRKTVGDRLVRSGGVGRTRCIQGRHHRRVESPGGDNLSRRRKRLRATGQSPSYNAASPSSEEKQKSGRPAPGCGAEEGRSAGAHKLARIESLDAAGKSTSTLARPRCMHSRQPGWPQAASCRRRVPTTCAGGQRADTHRPPAPAHRRSAKRLRACLRA